MPGTSLLHWARFVCIHAEAWTVTLDSGNGAREEANAIDSSLVSACNVLYDLDKLLNLEVQFFRREFMSRSCWSLIYQ